MRTFDSATPRALRSSRDVTPHGFVRFAMVALVMSFVSPVSAETPRRLKGAEIKQRFSGKVYTDGTHWKETYAGGGKFTASEMGHGTTNGAWRVDADKLCKTLPDFQTACYEVWSSGNRLELRFGQSTVQEGELRPASGR